MEAMHRHTTVKFCFWLLL